MAKVKEIWVRFNNEESYSDNEGKLFEILDKAQGDCIVKVFSTESKAIKKLNGHNFDEKQISLLANVFGDENVRYQESEQCEPKKIFRTPEIKQVIPCNHDMYAVVTDSAGKEYKRKVLMYALCDDGCIYPLHFDSELGISVLYDTFDVDRYEMEGRDVM